MATGLLQHDLGNPEMVGIAIRAPGERTLLARNHAAGFRE